jgi:UDP:flavonoid glycosyltransferase YjiC (YdhE family)
MRVLFTTRGSSGHVGPLVPFAKALVHAGHEVVVAAQRQHAANVERAGLELAPVGDPPADEWMPLMGQFAELDLETSNRVMISKFFAGIDVRAALPGLREIVEGRRPDVIVRESWEFGSTLVADLYGIPIARVGLGLAEVEEETVAVVAPELDEARATVGLPPDPRGDRLREEPYFTAMPEALEAPDAPTPARSHRFRFEVGEGAEALPDWWPGQDGPLVYVSFGSVAAGSHLPYYPELYRGAIEALAPLPARVLVTIGDPARETSELGPLPPNVHAETWVPHDDVAARSAAIVCHGGYGSTLASLAHGVPLVVLPLFSTDQWANGEAVARTGAGICLERGPATRSVLGLPGSEKVRSLGPAVVDVLEQQAYRREAERVAESMRTMLPVDRSVGILEAIAAGADGPQGSSVEEIR